jgi:hypothetical protein
MVSRGRRMARRTRGTSPQWSDNVPRWDAERTRKIQVAVAYLVKNNQLERGHQSRLAEYFAVSRQRVNQVVLEEKKRAQAVPAVPHMGAN